MGLLELDHDPTIARIKLQNEISGLGDNVMERTRSWIKFVAEHPEAGYTASQTPSESEGSAPLTVISDPDGDPVVTYRDRAYMQIHSKPDSSGYSYALRMDSYNVTLFGGRREGTLNTIGQTSHTLSVDRIALDRAHASWTQAKGVYRQMPRVPQPPTPAGA